MAGNNLSRADARRRSAQLRVQSYKVELDLTDGGSGPGRDTFRSTSTIRFSSAEVGASTFVDIIAPRVTAITLNGTAVDPAAAFDGERVTLSGLARDNVLEVVADCAYMRTGEGLHRFVDPVDEAVYLYTQFETSDAHRMYACFDQPDLKATFELSVIAPAGWQVVSNSPAAGDPAPVRDGVGRWEFTPTPPISTYITALIAGPYHVVRDVHHGRGGEIPLGLFCRSSLAEFLDPDDLFTVTKQGFTFFEAEFGRPYPFEKYDQLFVPEFNAGAMENAGAVTFLEDYVFRSKVTAAAYERRAETVLHEMAHMWFGDLVTMRWWDDLWLNESFASYVSVLAECEVTKYTGAWTAFANVEKVWAYRQDQLPSTHPIAADIVDIEAVRVNFDGITYAKGAAVLKQLVAWVGRDAFFAGLRSYFERHAWGNTTLQDLLSAIEASSARDLSAWSKEWLEAAGVNTLRADFQVTDGTYTAFAIVQEAPAQHPTLRSHRLAIGLYDRDDSGHLTRRQRLEIDVVGALTEVPALVGVTQPDLVLINDDDLTYAKIRLDERSLATLTRSIGDFTESLPRALCWTAAWDMLRDAEMAARDYVTLVLSGVDAESDIGVVQTLLRQARIACDNFAAPDYRETGLARIAAATLDKLRAAEPGGDHQLVWVRAFAAVASSPEHLGLLSGLLSGEQQVPGLTVDTELRWTLLHRLVVRGAAAEAEIDSELARDRTAAGERHAAYARAAMPTEAAKAQAWASLVESDTLPNALQSAVIGGFQQPDHRALLAGYVERYFAAVERIWATRTTEMAQNLVVGLFPSLVIEQSTLDRADAYLAVATPQPAMRRLVLEGRDTLARALRARARDEAAG